MKLISVLGFVFGFKIMISLYLNRKHNHYLKINNFNFSLFNGILMWRVRIAELYYSFSFSMDDFLYMNSQILLIVAPIKKGSLRSVLLTANIYYQLHTNSNIKDVYTIETQIIFIYLIRKSFINK